MVRWGGIVALGIVLSACFGPRLEAEQFGCENGLCPGGFRCIDAICVTEAGEPDPDAAPVADVDAGVLGADAAVDAMPRALCYDEIPTPIVVGATVVEDTTGGFDNAEGCNAGGPEHYYELVLDPGDVPATVEIDLGAMAYDPVLRVRAADCDDMAAEFICRDDGDAEFVSQLFTVPGSYFIIIDSHGFSNGGDYDLTVNVTPEN